MGNEYKIRAVMDTGSTTTIMSEGLFNELPNLKKHLQPTSFSFSGVSEGRDTYVGIIPNLQFHFSDKIMTEINVAIIPNKKKFLLIGNDLVGGAYSQLARVGQNDPLGYMVLQDKKGK